jgi:hypothetical protein
MKTAKDLAAQIAIQAMTTVSTEGLTGEEKEHKVIEFLVTLDNGVPMVNFVPDFLEAQIIEFGVDKIQEYISHIDIKAFVKKHYERIKHFLKIK